MPHLVVRLGPGVAWGAFAAALLALGGAILLGSHNASVAPASVRGTPDALLWLTSWLGFGIVGATVIQRRPTHTIGWLLLGIPTVTYLTLFLQEYAIQGLVVEPGSLPFALTAGWVSKWSFALTLGLVIALVLVFPRGRIDGRAMRLLGRAVAVLVAVLAVLLALEPTPIRSDVPVANPVAVTVLGDGMIAATSAVGHVLAGLALVTTIDAVRRWRRSSGVERLQFRWFASAVAAFPVLFLVGEVVSETIGATWSFDPVVIAFFVGLNGIAAAIGVAVTRYRLWEIDRLVNRTLVYAGVTVVLAATYVVGVVGTQALLPTGGSDLAVAASTLTVAALFGPVRRRVQRFVDRRFDRSRYDAARTIDRFASRVRQQVDVDVLAQEVLATVGSTLRPAHAGIWFPSRQASVTFSERPPATMPSTDR